MTLANCSRSTFPLLITVLALASTALFTSQTAFAQTDADKFVYADFEKVDGGRLVSNGGGLIQIFTGQESTPAQFKGLANASPGAPEEVALKGDEKNHVASFEYVLPAPNQWANVTLEIQGHASKDGKSFVPDDVSAYKNLAVKLYVTGVDGVRIEFISHGQGINLPFGFPQSQLRLKPGFNTYLIPLKSLSQPAWAQQKVDTKEVLRKLTAVSISVYCNGCSLQHGMVIVDNVVFEK